MKIKELIENFKKRKALYYTYTAFLYLFAIYGFGLTAAFFGVKLHIFDDPGGVDQNDRYFQKVEGVSIKQDSSYVPIKEVAEFATNLKAINAFFPKSAKHIYSAFLQHQDIDIAMKAIEAVKIRHIENTEFQKVVANPKLADNMKALDPEASAFEWMNVEEWQHFKEAVYKDKDLIDSASKLLDLDPRLIVGAVVGEQMRLLNSKREMYKNVIRPLKILSVESKFSLGVTGIKEHNAILVEKYLKDPASEYYLGQKYEHLLDFKTSDPTTERFNRLVDYRNHFYSYLYAGVIIKQFITQWKKAGYDISNRPEILITLYNVGFPQSKPGPNPQVGGSRVEVNGTRYSFGALGYEFYYSGEMVDVFPYQKRSNKVINNNVKVGYSQPKPGGFAPKPDSATTTQSPANEQVEVDSLSL